ncbi:hypothetical protein F3J20_16135 [Paraburkholderia sp. Cy-641]|uniref:hypothetical protein n=1 Tax=Paraburkholderia sp. Cy-641 TaxID=2608337 RepID=UPI0014205C2D|nr:hypothetical protein [Paraburkholderia sp. Cy-641]NIF78897.1 hypothetical protein [Paraburkholderia sp. Cy-641]
MSIKASARPEQSKQSPINLASLPRDEALQRAREVGRAILHDSTAVSDAFDGLWVSWMNANIPKACGQSEGEFGELIDSMMGEFEDGLNDFVRSARANLTLTRVEHFLATQSRFAWKIYNVIAFMVEAVPDDAAGALPIRCTLMDLREDIDKLATSLMDVDWSAYHG